MNQFDFHRSPFFYVGDKYKLLKSIHRYFPKEINNFYEPFLGGGSVFLNTKANHYSLNDIDKNVYELHQYLIDNAISSSFFKRTFSIIRNYGLSLSCLEDSVPYALKQKYKKTYYAHYNKVAYNKLKSDYQNSKSPLLLYLLIIYGFNRMIRFNRKGDFNLPVGNVDFNSNVLNALNYYFSYVKDKDIMLHNLDFHEFIRGNNYTSDDFIYCDPPYLITSSEYNKIWNEKKEKLLLDTLDKLNGENIKFAISNVTNYKNNENQIFINWMKKYKVIEIKSNYISYHDNTKKNFREVLVINY